MKLWDYTELSLSNLWKRKLRTFLTTFGVVIGIGALVAMVSFGKGMQRNVTDTFNTLELFNYITVFPDAVGRSGDRSPRQGSESRAEQRLEKVQGPSVLDDAALGRMEGLEGVESVFPDVRFPAQIVWEGAEEFTLVQVLPVRFASSKLVKLRAGKGLTSDDEQAAIFSDTLLRRLGIHDFEGAVGKEVTVSALAFDAESFSLGNLAAFIGGRKLPFTRKDYILRIAGVSERMGFGGPMLLRSDVILPEGTAADMEKINITSLWDLFNPVSQAAGFNVVNVKLVSPMYVDDVKAEIETMGFGTFALADQMEEIKTGFLFMDMFLLAIGMIAIVVASLGIVNTMVMSILERYSEIGVMKAVGASNRDIEKIFFFESSVIGVLGGILGLILGWIVSKIINQVANFLLSRQGVPYIEYFDFPWWLILGSIGFAILVSMISGIYPSVRASRVDPVVALRHD
jgi:putative ABC transport system permease protein